MEIVITRLFNTAYISVFTLICKFRISDFTAVKHDDCLYFFSFLIFFCFISKNFKLSVTRQCILEVIIQKVICVIV